MTAATIYVALLRAVNVGGNNIVSMKALKESFERLGFLDVSTYINSGNILFRAAEPDARRVEAKIDRMLARDHGLKSKAVVRSDREMGKVVRIMAKTWPAPEAGWRYNVMFLRHDVDPKGLVADSRIVPELERVVCCPGTLLWSARIDALHRTAMQKVGSRPVYQEMTVRNVNTTRAILTLMRRMKEDARA